MQFPGWMSLMRRVFFLCGVAIFAVCSASAQSSISANPDGSNNNPASSNPVAADESSSSSVQLTADNGVNDAVALRTATDAIGEGAGGGQAEGGGWKHGMFSSSHLAFEAGAGF